MNTYQSPGATVVSPFGSKTASGSPVSVRVVTVTPGWATGNLADGGWRIGLEVINKTRYACYIPRAAGTGLGDETAVGRVGTENSGPQQAC
ncbi:hypothetical protein [Streptomyces sp. RKND-216]|uniref:hypothetical protein n=1 Tax=Streptomyces sp. RKND-216 TaxID=2562581 RepID=UPI001FFA2163|nr:hypothetical protein [Streptomyces sp. RKND-216]